MIPMVPHNQVVIEAQHENVRQSNDKLLQSHKIWMNFDDISKIYRESGHNQQISEYLKIRLQKAGFKVVQKKDGTICAIRGLNKEKNNAIILQSHMDMVGISSDGNPQKPIKLILKDGWIYPNDRTLGADDGIGVSAMLTVANDVRFKKYPLEMIFTTDEETGMTGARNLCEKDFYGIYLINLDSEKYGDIVTGCAGISNFRVNEKIQMLSLEKNDTELHSMPDLKPKSRVGLPTHHQEVDNALNATRYDFKKISVSISGARGGHSAEIQPDSLNPIKILLAELKGKDIKLVSLSGGERDNAIPRDAKAEFLVPASQAEEIQRVLKSRFEQMKQEKLPANPDLKYSISAENVQIGTQYVAPQFQRRMLEDLNSIPTGLLSRFEDGGSTKTSQNLGVVKIGYGQFNVQIMGRSADEKEGLELREKTSLRLSELFDKKISVNDTMPIWQPKKDSFLQDAASKAYFDVSAGQNPTITVEHGGLEPAIFIEKKPDLEQISIGPTIEEPHSIHERVKVKTILPFYKWLAKILELLSKN